jgi:hypothetical protein
LKKPVLLLPFCGLAVGFMLLTAQPSFATVSGELQTGGNGTVTVSATSLEFTTNDTSTFSTEVAVGSNVVFAGCPSGVLGTPGCLSQGEGVDIAGGNTINSLGPIASFLTFQNDPSLVYSLSGYQPGSANTNCAALLVGQTCSVFAGSPVVLTLLSGGQTDAELGVFGTVTDGVGPASNWNGHFTATIAGATPADLQSIIAAGGSVTHSYSGDFIASVVPEPRLVSLLAFAGIFLVIAVQKRRRQQQA